MKNTRFLFALIMIMIFSLNVRAQIKILVVTGGHDYDTAAFFQIFDAMEGVQYESALQPDANSALTSDTISKYACIVFYDMFQPITEEQKAAYLRLLDEGMGMVFLHHSLVSYQDWPEFRQIVGGKYNFERSAPGNASTYKHDVDLKVLVADSNHPVTKGVSDFMIHDEVYGNYAVNDDVHILLKTQHPESTPEIGWCHKYRQAKVVFLQPGHDHFAYGNENYRKLIYNAIRWVSGK